MVPEARLELARLERRGILNPLCLPIPPLGQIGAGNEARTRDPDLGKVVLYQLSYSRFASVQRALIIRIFAPRARAKMHNNAGLPKNSSIEI